MPRQIDSSRRHSSRHTTNPAYERQSSRNIGSSQYQYQPVTASSSRSNAGSQVSMRRPTAHSNSTPIGHQASRLEQAQRELEVLRTRLMLLRTTGDSEERNIPVLSDYDRFYLGRDDTSAEQRSAPATPTRTRLSMRATCIAHPDCIRGNTGPIAQLGTSQVHIGCLANITLNQVMGDSRLPTKITVPHTNIPISWANIKQAFDSVEAEMQSTPRDWLSFKTVARALLSNRDVISQLKRDDAIGFIEFSLDTCDQVSSHPRSSTNGGRTPIPKQTLLAYALEAALERRIGFRFTELVNKMLSTSNEPDFVINGTSTDRDTLEDWTKGRNLPRGINLEEPKDSAAAKIMEIMRNGGHWGGHENSMDLTVGEYTTQKFYQIISLYTLKQLSRSKIFAITQNELIKFNNAMNIAKSRSKSAKYKLTQDERKCLKQASWSWRTDADRFRHVLHGLQRAKEECLVSERYGNESQATALHKLMSYICSSDHDRLQKFKLMDRLCSTLEGIGKGTMNDFGYESHENECHHGQVGAILNTPFGTDLSDQDDETIPQISPEDLHNILMRDMKQHLHNEGSSVQVLIASLEDTEQDQESSKKLLNVLKDMFVESMLNKHCLHASTGINETQLRSTIDRIWPKDSDPELLIGLT